MASIKEQFSQLVPNVRDKQVSSALRRLVCFSLAIIFIPLSCMFLFKKFVFEAIFGYSSGDSVLYAAIVAVVVVHVILAGFVYVAWKEDDGPAHVIPEKQD